jgi:membrane-associated phospholipid phosphatase
LAIRADSSQGFQFEVMAVGSLLVLLIGFSRVALGVRYFSDVTGGFLIGGAWLFATAAFSAWRIDEGKPPFHPSEGLEPGLTESP